ncbi:SDR family NAD(P)-dependent oxidoreductase [Prauserella rugosa]|uniref:2-deoxy-D-gluconate 3-dehydrogenase n=1 Tax=Prauserella rugosa TaxID=43354 RepID=A0A660CAH8_9PSEU|nr:glucose 1-dehydrogenase [Prauserella rugosa]KMS69323.1 2-deoxy-D-gluconate 3-dehydrogenase [Streptomyces regensis]TWH18753.1 2-deoxy-D-gluconate 3-dehydrogenase [Prauserella rugosa]
MTETTPALAGKTAIVTGAGRGLGRAMAVALADAGADVALAARSKDQLDTVAEEVTRRGRRAMAVPTDVTDADAVRNLVDRTVDHFGHLDVVVNNSGVIDSRPLLEQDHATWDRVVDTNLRGTYLVTRAAGEHLVAQGSGKVVNVASNFAFKGIANHAAYCASKAAVVAFTKAMAVEWAPHGVQVNALAPGYFATDLNADLRADPDALAKVVRAVPARRMGEAPELASWLVLLAGPASDFMTGEAIVIDGGQTAR